MSDNRLEEMPSIYSLVSANKIKKIDSAKNIFSNIIKNIPSEDYKKFKIEYDQSNDISISELFYLTGNAASKTLFNKAAKSAFEKDKVFVNLYNQLENKKFFKKPNQDSLPITTPFYDFKSNVDHSTLLSFLSYCMLILQILDF